jgi:hypothetical protein
MLMVMVVVVVVVVVVLIFFGVVVVVMVVMVIGLWRGVSKGVKDGHRPPALQAGHPRDGCKAVLGVARVKNFRESVDTPCHTGLINMLTLKSHPLPPSHILITPCRQPPFRPIGQERDGHPRGIEFAVWNENRECEIVLVYARFQVTPADLQT